MVKSLKEKIAELKSKSSLIKSKAEKGNKFALFKLGWICFDDNDVIIISASSCCLRIF